MFKLKILYIFTKTLNRYALTCLNLRQFKRHIYDRKKNKRKIKAWFRKS